MQDQEKFLITRKVHTCKTITDTLTMEAVCLKMLLSELLTSLQTTQQNTKNYDIYKNVIFITQLIIV